MGWDRTRDVERIRREIHCYWDRGWPVRCFKDDIIARTGRVLLARNQVDHYLVDYRRFWNDDERGRQREELEGLAIYFGDHYLQAWWMIRDLVPITRRVRGLRRRSRFCAVCGRCIDRLSNCGDWSDDDQEHFHQIVGRRHFMTQIWEIRCEKGLSLTRARSRIHWGVYTQELENYRTVQRASIQLVCSIQCEATRFSRWLGSERWKLRLARKERGREKKERQWIQQGKQALKNVQLYLSRRVSI